MLQDKLKKEVGWAVLEYICPNTIIGVGSGSTVAYFIEALGSIKNKIKGVVSSSKTSSIKLRNLGIPLLDLNDLISLDIYIDSADEINKNMEMIKGGGAALTREKIIASVSNKFICIADDSKVVEKLGSFPVPIEVIPMAREWVIREILKLGGIPNYRKNVITDNGNIILDIHKMNILDAKILEAQINNIPGVVTVGLFAHRCADLALISDNKTGIKVFKKFNFKKNENNLTNKNK